MGRIKAGSILLLLAMLVTACARPAPSGQADAAGSATQPARTKRITASVMGDIPSFVSRLSMTQISPAGASAVEQLVNGSLAELNGDWKLNPQLGESVPSLDNGLWRALPDGKMETIWKIRPDAVWHDGAPLTADDFVFTTTVDRDRDLPIPRQPAYALIDSVEAVDPHTVRVVWTRPYIEADQFFTARIVPPLPKHILGDTYENDKSSFTNLPYWNDAYVGTGPFMVKAHQPGSSITLQAFDKYAPGRPKIDEIEIKVFLDLNTLVTNLMSGTVEMTLGRGFTAEQAIQMRDQWRDGVVETNPRAWVEINPQFIEPSPAIVGDVQFRKALMYGTDRQQLVDTLQGGMTTVADLFVNPSFPEYNDVKDAAVKYPYDPRMAAQMIEGLGYTKGPDGVYRDGVGNRLAVELRNNTEVITEKSVVPVANFWTQLGVATDPLIVPPQRINDRQWVAEFPAFRMMRQPNDTIQITRLHSQFTPLPENGYAGSNYSRYQSSEFDAALDKYVSTIPWDERMQALRQAIHHMTDNLNNMGLFYDMEFTLASKRLKDITAREVTIWDANKWDVN